MLSFFLVSVHSCSCKRKKKNSRNCFAKFFLALNLLKHYRFDTNLYLFIWISGRIWCSSYREWSGWKCNCRINSSAKHKKFGCGDIKEKFEVIKSYILFSYHKDLFYFVKKKIHPQKTTSSTETVTLLEFCEK